MANNSKQNSFHEIIRKMNEAKKYYNELMAHIYDNSKGEYKRERDITYDDEKLKEFNSKLLQPTYSAIDSLLNAFIDEKQIVKIKNQYGQNLEDTKSLICAILSHNETHNTDYLTDVDFVYLCKDKDSRNLDYHRSECTELISNVQKTPRIFANLNKILLSLDVNSDKESVELEEPSRYFHFETFRAYIVPEDEDNNDRRLILITESLHNVNRDHLATFLRLPWSLILDFDGSTAMGGLETVLDNYCIQHNTYDYDYTKKNNISFANQALHIRLNEKSLREHFFAKQNETMEDYSFVRMLMKSLSGQSFPKATIVVVGDSSERINSFCKKISLYFPTTAVLFLSTQRETQNIQYHLGGIATQLFNNSVSEALESIYKNKDLLPLSQKEQFLNNTDDYKMPPNIRLKKSFVEQCESEIEFVHQGLGNGDSANEWDFYHGDTVTWEAINRQLVLPLRDQREFQQFANKMKDAPAHSIFYIYHLPGFGGSTLGRQLVWNIHDKIPVVILKKYSGLNDFQRLLNDLYHCFNNTTFWMMVDRDSIVDGDIDEIEHEIKHGDYNVCALIIKRVSESSAKQINKKKADNEMIVSMLEAEQKRRLADRCQALLQNNAQFEERRKNMNELLEEDDKCPLLINLYLLENFRLNTYVKSFIDKIPDGIDGNRERDILEFMAITSYYSNLKLPVTYYTRHLLTGKDQKDLLTPWQGIVLRKKSTNSFHSPINVCINHFLVAKEILQQLLCKNELSDWKDFLLDSLKKYIDWIANLLEKNPKMDDEIKNLFESLFTDKTQSGSWSNDKSNFTKLLTDMGDFQRCEIMKYLTEKMSNIIENGITKGEGNPEYKLLAYMYAQLARVRIKNWYYGNDDEEELDDCVEKVKDIILTEGIYEYALEDMLARCSLDRACKIRESKELSELSQDDVNTIIHYVDDAVDRFKQTLKDNSDYAVPGEMSALIFGFRTLVDFYKWPEETESRHNCISKNKTAEKYFNESLILLENIEEYELKPESLTIYYEKKNELESIIWPGTPSKLIEYLNNQKQSVAADDHTAHCRINRALVLAYEKKHFTKEHRRMALITKALSGDNKAKEDVKKVFCFLDKIVDIANDSVPSGVYYKWFEYSKLMEVDLNRAKLVAARWNDKERGSRGNPKALIKSKYYLFVISLLQYCAGSIINKNEVADRKQELENTFREFKTSKSAVQDWFCKGKQGMRQLFSNKWIDISNVAEQNDIAAVEGKVVDFDKKSYVGYIKISEPKGMCNWKDPKSGSSYNKDCCVRFKEDQSKLINESSVGGEKYRLKFGFSYENLVASWNSIESLNSGSEIIGNKQNNDRSANTSKDSPARAVNQKSQDVQLPKENDKTDPDTNERFGYILKYFDDYNRYGSKKRGFIYDENVVKQYAGYDQKHSITFNDKFDDYLKNDKSDSIYFEKDKIIFPKQPNLYGFPKAYYYVSYSLRVDENKKFIAENIKLISRHRKDKPEDIEYF